MKYIYGTSGFRFHADTLMNIAYEIGKAVRHLQNLHRATKCWGIMITASHNPSCDNGVKIIYDNGMMLSEIDEIVITKFVNQPKTIKPIRGKRPQIIIGYDTRATSPDICYNIIDGYCDYDISHAPFVYTVPLISTPYHHTIVYQFNYGLTFDALNYYKRMKTLMIPEISNKFVIDCANGIGYNICHKLFAPKHLINTDIRNHRMLNNNCGSEYVQHHYNDINLTDFVDYHISLDGDADRMVMIGHNNDTNILIDGDYQMMLVCCFIKLHMPHIIKHYNIAVIHTIYTNSAIVKYVNSMGFKTICVATGMKNLMNMSKFHEIIIAWETNGHGSVFINTQSRNHNIIELTNLFNQTVGDGVNNAITMLYLFYICMLTPASLVSYAPKVPAKTIKLVVADKSIYITNHNDTKLLKPVETRESIKQLSAKYNASIYVRPSGTENVLRVHIEAPTYNIIDIIASELTII